jgi:hypothetical protein
VRISILPKTSLGRWSIGLAIAFILFWLLIEAPSDFNKPFTVGDTIGYVGISGAAFVTGLISVLKNRERSVLVFAGVVISGWMGLIGGIVGQFFI